VYEYDITADIEVIKIQDINEADNFH